MARRTFGELDFHEKSSIITSWIHTVAVVAGILYGLVQVTLAIDAFKSTKLTKTYEHLEKFEEDIEVPYKTLTEYYMALYPPSQPENAEKHLQKIREKYATEKINEYLETFLQEVDRLIRLSESGILEKEIVKLDLTSKIALLIARINDEERYPKGWDMVPAARQRLEVRFYEVAPFYKRLFYSQTGQL